MWNTLSGWWKKDSGRRVSRRRLWSGRLLCLERLEDRTLLSGAPLAAAPLSLINAFQTAHADGRLASSNQVDLYRVHLSGADSVSVAVSSQASGGALNSVLRIFDSSGTPLALDDQEGGDASLTFQAPTEGDYLIGVSSAGNDAYRPSDPSTDRGGSTTGLYTLNLRQTSQKLLADLAGSSFRLAQDTATWGEQVSVSFSVENRGGAASGAFTVQLFVSPDPRIDPSNSLPVGKALSVAGLSADQSFSPGALTFTLPDAAKATGAGLPASGPVYLGLRITPADAKRDAGMFDKGGVHRGEDWETVTVLTPVPAGVTDLSQADPGLNIRADGNLSAGQTNTYTFTITATQGSGRLTAKVSSTGGTLAPRLALEGPLGVGSGPEGASVGLRNGKGYAGLHFSQSDNLVPPDSQGAAGPASYVEAVNQTVAIFSKATGVARVADGFSHFWSLGGLAPVDSSGLFSDPVVTYDDNVPGQTPPTGRFLVCDQNVDFNTGASVLDIAVSTSADPATLTAADWNFYQINTTETNFFSDYPGNLGFNRDALIVTLNQLDLVGSANHAQVNAVNIQDLVAGVAPDRLRFSQSDVNDLSLRPATEHNAAAGDPEWLVAEAGDGQHINVYKMTAVLSAAPTFSRTQLAVHPYTDIGVVPPLQPDGSAVTTTIDSRIQKAAEANNTLVATHAVSLSPTEDAAQWYAIDVSSGTPVLEQQGDVSLGNNTYASYPAIDISPAGAVGMTFMDSGTAAGQYPSMYVTGRLPGDPAGQMAKPALVPAGAGQTNYHDFAGGRAGDLSGINIDPVDGSFWAVNEFANQEAGANWGTAIANFGLAAGPGGASVGLRNGKGYAGLHFSQSDNLVPPDSQGAAGPASYVEAVNQTVAIFSKATGVARVADGFSHFWSLGGLAPVDSSGLFSDPVVTYDDNVPGQTPPTGRFLVCDQNVDFNTGASVLDIAVSTSADPATLTAADWNFYQINTTETNFFSDYPGNLGFNRDALVVTLNQFDLIGPDAHVQVNAINIQDLVNGVATDQLRFSQSDVNDLGLRPATEHNAAAGDPEWLVAEAGDGQHINVYKMTAVLSAAPTFSLTGLSVHPYTEITPALPSVDVPRPLQPDGSAVTTNIDSRIQKAAEANNTLVAAHAVSLSATEDAAQWYAIDVSSGTPVLEQQGDVSLGNNTYASYPAIDISPAGAVGMTFMDSGTAAGQYPSMYVTGRLPGDPAGQMAKPALVPAGAGQTNLHSFLRAGDLSGINIDPVDGSFWAVNEFANREAGANWGTAIANFGLAINASPSNASTPSRKGQVLVQSDDGAIVQHLQPGTYVLSVSTRSGEGNYQLVSEFVQANPPLNPAAVGPYPSSVVVADVNGDGIPDIISTNGGANTVSVLLGNGDGSFQPQQTFAVGSRPKSVAVADINGDGKPDLIVANYSSASISVLLGNGDGSFRPQQTFSAYYPNSVAVADVNGDGKPDIVVASYGSTVGVLLNTTAPGASVPSFASQQTFDVGPAPRSVAVADVNGDGKPDLVTANYTSYRDTAGRLHILAGTVSVLLNTTAPAASLPSFASQRTFTVGYSPGAVAVADVNGDGKPDLVVANFQGNNAEGKGLSVLLGNGDGTFQPQRNFNTGFVPFSLAVGDLNNDGNLDVVVGNFGAHTESVLLGKSDGTFAAPQSFATGFYPGAVVVADVNGDGKPDVVVANSGSGYNPGSSVGVLLGNGDGTLQAPPTISAGAAPQAVVVADVNGDGKPDLIAANAQDNTVSVLLGEGDGSFQAPHTFATGGIPQAVIVADLNRDGKPDIVVANFLDNTVSVLLGNGDGSFQGQHTFGVGDIFENPGSLAVADVNGDGIPDLIIANFYDSTVGVLLGNGDGSFQPQQTFSAFYPNSVAVADVNGDGKPDLVVASYGNTVGVLLNTTPKGATTASFQKQRTFAAGSNPTAVAVADVNGDGKPDLVVGHYSGYPNVVSVLLGNGDGSFRTQQTFTTGTDPSSVAVAKVNGDGKPSIIAANFRGNSVTVLEGDGKGNFPIQQAIGAGFTPTAVNVADVNGDGKPDLVVGNEFGGSLTVLLGTSDGTFTPATPGREAGLRNTPYLADVNGDGLPDSVILDRAGNLLFRKGVPGSVNTFAPPVILNPGHPARDLTLVQTPSGLAIATVDATFDPTLATPSSPLVYTVSLYTVAADGSASRRIAFSTTRLPTRIAAAGLTGSGREDLVVANSLDNSIQVAFQQPDGSFSGPLTLGTGEAPSDISLVDVNGDGLPDIAVSNQASGDVSVFLNDKSHSFATGYRFRGGLNLYGLDSVGPNLAVSSREQTVSLAAGDFTGTGRNDLVVVNRGAHSFSVLQNDGNGGFTNPQAGLTTPTSLPGLPNNQPGPLVAGDFNGDGHLDLAILMEDRGQVWIYCGDGHGHFTFSSAAFAGADPTGLTAVPGAHGFDLLVGNPFGDILRLVGNGDGTFAPLSFTGDRSTLDATALEPNGPPEVLLGDQKGNTVTVQAPVADSASFQPVQTVPTVATPTQLAPGAVQWMKVNGPGDPTSYAVVMGTGSNSVQVTRVASVDAAGNPIFADPRDYPVGSEPVGVAFADLNGDGIPDMLVANYGSNDLSVLFGSLDPKTGAWEGIHGPRLASGGVGPVAVALRDVNGDGIPDLVITNAKSGTLTILSGRGLGFFDDRNPQIIPLLTRVMPGPAPGQGPDVIPTEDGRLLSVDLGSPSGDVRTIFTPPAGERVNAVQETGDGAIFVALGGSEVMVEELRPDAAGNLTVVETFASQSGIPSNPSALLVLETATGPEVLVTDAGSDHIFVFSPGPGPNDAGSDGVFVFSPGPGLNVTEASLSSPSVPAAPAVEVAVFSQSSLTPNVNLVAALLPNEAAAAEAQTSFVFASAATSRIGTEEDDTEADSGQPENDSPLDAREELRRLDLYEPTPDANQNRPTPREGPEARDTGLGNQDFALATAEANPFQPLPDRPAGKAPVNPVAAETSVAQGSVNMEEELPSSAPAPSPTPAQEDDGPPTSGDRPEGESTLAAEQVADAVFLQPGRGWESSIPFLAAVAGGLGLWYRERLPEKEAGRCCRLGERGQ